MFTKSFTTLAIAVALVLGTTANAATVGFYSTRDDCDGSPSDLYENVACDTCITPGLDWYAVQVSDISSSQRWSLNNEKDCTSKSQVGQSYGDGCGIAGHTAIKSAYIAC